MSEQEQEAYSEKLLAEIPDYAKALEDVEKKTARAKAIRNLTKFMRVSYYVSGK